MQILNWLASCKPRQFSSATSVPDVVQQLCILAAEQHPSDTHDKDEEAMDDCPPPRLFAPQVTPPPPSTPAVVSVQITGITSSLVTLVIKKSGH